MKRLLFLGVCAVCAVAVILSNIAAQAQQTAPFQIKVDAVDGRAEEPERWDVPTDLTRNLSVVALNRKSASTVQVVNDTTQEKDSFDTLTGTADCGEISKLHCTLSAVTDPEEENAYDGSLENFSETEFVAQDESETTVKISPSGSVSLSAEGNPGFVVDFINAVGPIKKTFEQEPLSFDSGPDAVLIPQIIDLHFRGVFVLESSSSPTEFSMQLRAQDALELVQTAEGGVLIKNASGENIGGFGDPWVKDKHNRKVPTFFQIDEQSVRQIVDTSNLTPDDFPVVADPPIYVNYTKNYIIDINDYGNVAQWKFLNQCTALKKQNLQYWQRI